MSAMVLLLSCLAAGILLQRTGKLPDNAPAALNAYVINVALPALALTHLHATALTVDLLASAAGAWLMLGAAALFIGFVASRMDLSAATTGALILTGGLANTSFVGLPMIEAWIGRNGLPYGIVIDQLGSYLALSTFGLMVATRYSSQPMQWSVSGSDPHVSAVDALCSLWCCVRYRPIRHYKMRWRESGNRWPRLVVRGRQPAAAGELW